MRVMRIYCPECSEVAMIKKTNRKHAQISDVYCACSNVECGHTFVMNVTFSHTLSPSAITHGHMLKGVIESIPPERRQDMIDMLSRAQSDDKKLQQNDKLAVKACSAQNLRGG
ncbi:ogr/Delta-like zinc finger family protein [Buttiauxella sp. A111]|uniref:ogr/Delta-like zinc finger family protein n=1 Tax=Buttiauxella sp. A111 TaxID=2563088 RepID=UPI0010E97371|nr:ogr/Delta-like zinc finger family protein [Buttiauxella sp. A111]GDX04839.1 transcriptional regulator [Buttiauxella sp. A111]